jgi:uncharacterized protein YgiM (DUF1202 family)
MIMNKPVKALASAFLALTIGSVGVALPAFANTDILKESTSVTLAKGNKCDLSPYTTAVANLRSSPSLSGKIKGSIPAGKCVPLSSVKWDSRGVFWVYTTYKGKSGWVSSRNLDGYFWG